MKNYYRFFLVFLITLVTTICVATASIVTDRSWLQTVLYSVTSMWIMGTVSQLVIHHLYLGVVKPMEDREYQHKVSESAKLPVDLEKIKEVEDVSDIAERKSIATEEKFSEESTSS